MGGVKAWIHDGSIWVTSTYVSDSPCSGEIPAEICVSCTVWWSNDRTLVEFQSYFPNLHKENPTEKGTLRDFDIYTRVLEHILKTICLYNIGISVGSNNSNAFDYLLSLFLNFCLLFVIEQILLSICCCYRMDVLKFLHEHTVKFNHYSNFVNMEHYFLHFTNEIN